MICIILIGVIASSDVSLSMTLDNKASSQADMNKLLVIDIVVIYILDIV